MLLSLQAGGVGLNLMGANHVFILDMHWNPALEEQAADRCHRVGQTRDVHIHRSVYLPILSIHVVIIGASLSKPHTSVYGGTILLCVRTSVRPPYRICAYAPNIRQRFAC